MFEKIIVPLDGSTLAETALPYAEEIAGRLGSEMILIHVAAPKDKRSENMLKCYLGDTAKNAKAGAEKYLGESGAKEIKVETRILTGDPAEEIVSFADKTEGAKIIMATNGESGITRWAMGSVADKVTRATIRPIAIIRARGSQPEVHPQVFLKSILAPLDGSKESEASLPYVIEMATRLKAEVTLLHVLKLNYISPNLEHVAILDTLRKTARDYLANIADSLKQKGLKVKYDVVEAGRDEAMEIIDYTQKNYMDVIIMSTHGRSGVRRWVLGSVTSKILRQGNTPIMLIRTPGANED